jgi:hypothetical protein
MCDINANILFIKGVFIKDCTPIDEIFEKHMLDRLNIDKDTIIYTKLPILFTEINSWIKTTNLNCWYCDLSFDNIPIFLPTSIEQYIDSYHIGVSGCFCSFSCLMSHINLHYFKISEYVKYRDMSLLLYKIFNGKSINEIIPTPSKFTMIKYGGYDTIEIYKNKIYDITKKMKELEY